MLHSFTLNEQSNGNTTIVFYENNKKRSIILQSKSQPHSDFKIVHEALPHLTLKELVTRMKAKYFFKANPNNKSIFRPVRKDNKQIILKS